MADLKQLEFFLLRYVPDAVKDEFVNIGLVMLEPGSNGSGYADVRFTKDWRHALCLDPLADLEMLEALERDIRRQLGEAKDRDVWLGRLKDSLSNIIQLSSTKACLAENPAREIETLASLYFERPKFGVVREPAGRQKLLAGMHNAFDREGIGELVRDLPVAVQAKYGFKFDFGYRMGETIKLFQAVSLKSSMDQGVRVLAHYPKVADRIDQDMQLQSYLTAVVDDDLDRSGDEMQFILNAMSEKSIRIAAAAEMALIAEQARRELRA